MTAIVIRPYQNNDWPEVCRVHDWARVQELALGGVDPRAFRPMVEVAEADSFFVSETLVACLDDAVVGFASWDEAYLTWLYVDPAFQRQGIGRRLLGEALARIGSEAWTTMIAGNEPALALYRAAGMDVVKTLPSVIEGYSCLGLRLALPTSHMFDPAANKRAKPPA